MRPTSTLFRGCLFALPLLLSVGSSAQPGFDLDGTGTPSGISSDGNRWVEVEVIVFKALVNRSNELANPGKLSLSYFPNPRLLATPLDSYAYPFEADLPREPAENEPAFPLTGARPLSAFGGFEENEEQREPEFDFSVPAQPAVPGSFKVLDLSRDPYVKLDARSARLSAAARNLTQAPDYEVLWHETWRQPLLDRAQVSAIVVQAGDRLDEHSALEGSVRLSRSGQRARLDLNLWLNEFGIPDPTEAARWQVPVVPEVVRAKLQKAEEEETPLSPLAPVNATIPERPQRGIVRIWQLQVGDELNLERLHYLDHPVLGALVEIRPYVLPETIAPELPEEF